MKDRIQPWSVIKQTEDVEPFDIQKSFKQDIDAALNFAATWLNNIGAPYVFITTLKVVADKRDDGVTYLSSMQNVRSNNINSVRDYALCFSHAAVASVNHGDMGRAFAKLAVNSQEFIEAFFAELQKSGALVQLPKLLPDNNDPTVH